ncbi:alpha/beta hydrolase, partial [Brevundimonas sp.]
FRREGEGTFDQKDIRAEAAAFNAFLAGAIRGYALEADKLMLLGYSNGADMIGALACLYPDSVKQAVLLRPMPALSGDISADKGEGRLLLLSGADDNLVPPQGGETLRNALEGHGYRVDHQSISAGHWMVDADEAAIAAWLMA